MSINYTVKGDYMNQLNKMQIKEVPVIAIPVEVYSRISGYY